jgi:hypothetical protein
MITPRVMIAGAFVFFACFLLHCLIWRLRRPEREIGWLALIFILLPACCWAVAKVLLCFNPPGLLFAYLEHCALSAAYIMSYPAIEADSPSLKIIRVVAAAPAGMNSAEIKKLFGGDMAHGFKERLKKEAFITGNGQTEALTAKGRVWVGIFSAYRSLLGLPEGKG